MRRCLLQAVYFSLSRLFIPVRAGRVTKVLARLGRVGDEEGSGRERERDGVPVAGGNKAGIGCRAEPIKGFRCGGCGVLTQREGRGWGCILQLECFCFRHGETAEWM